MALTAFLLAPLVILVVLCWLIAVEIDRQNKAGPRHRTTLPTGSAPAPAPNARPGD